jgi:general secretion pathway protein A
MIKKIKCNASPERIGDRVAAEKNKWRTLNCATCLCFVGEIFRNPRSPMYNAHFKFRECPFGVTPDPQFYYSNAVYREAWATLRYGIEGRKGFIVIAGEAGTGKTTLLRKALHQFPSNIKAAYIPSTLVSFTELLRLILKDLGLPSPTDSKFDMMERLNQYLLEQSDSGDIVALLIDEAQDLSVQCLEELRLLGNLETDKHKLLQIVLVGQPGLERKLNRPELLQLKQRVVLRCRLRPVETGEVGAYIESRLQTIGHRSADLFDPESIEKIAFYSKGFPRLINVICDNALLTAYAASKFKVSAAMIDEVTDDLLIGESRVEPEVLPGALTRPVEEKASLESTPTQEHDPTTREEPHRDSTPSRNGAPYSRPIIATPADDLPIGASRVEPEVRAGGLTGRVEEKASFESAPAQEHNPTTREEPRRDSTPSRSGARYSRPIIGTLAAIVLLTVLGGFLYSQRGAFSDFNSSSNIAAPVASARNEMDQAKLAAPALEPKPFATNPQPTLPAPHTETESVSNQNLSTARPGVTTNVPAGEKKVAAQQVPTAPIAPENKNSEPPPRDDRRENAPSAEDFLVAGASFVRSQPTSNAEIIATLKPGTRINVAGRTGEYYRVRSLGTETIRGYVHKEDAFFERH